MTLRDYVIALYIRLSANDKPVLLQKDGVTIEITLGKAEYKKGNEVLKSEKAAELKDSKIYVGSDVIE